MAKDQLALDFNCQLSDFNKEGNNITKNILRDGRCIYRSDDCFLKILCIEGKAIICADDKISPWFRDKILNLDLSWLFDHSNVREIDNKFKKWL